jgi:aspartyl-tRNA(Asn)/glutamyl-tRNA(Gln) amidotransferase subunit A
VGLKPSAGAVSRRGVFPLAASLDSVGPLGVSVQCCEAVFRLLADVPVADVAAPARPLRLGLLTTTAMDGLDDVVAADFARACATLRWQGVEITEFACPELAELPGLMANGGLSAFEAYAVHGARLAAVAEAYDPRVASRIALGAKVDVDAVRHFKARRAAIIARFASAAVGFDAVICPTVATIPPLLQDLAGDDDYRRINGLCLRNTALFNFLDGCSISVPMNRAGAAPTGLMLSATGGNDAQLLAVAAEVAGKITPSR